MICICQHRSAKGFGSRDYQLDDLRCECRQCQANRYGKCTMTSAVVIGANRVCKTGTDLIKPTTQTP